MESEEGFLRLSNKKLLEELKMLWWAYCKDQIWLHLSDHLINELHLVHMMCFFFVNGQNWVSRTLKQPPAVYNLDKRGKVRQENIYS